MNDWTSLMNATYWGHRETFELQLEIGAETDPKDIDSKMINAAYNGHVEILLKIGADINAKARRARQLY